jgi:hypothetical protein
MGRGAWGEVHEGGGGGKKKRNTERGAWRERDVVRRCKEKGTWRGVHRNRCKQVRGRKRQRIDLTNLDGGADDEELT